MASALVLYNEHNTDNSFSGIDFNNQGDLVDSRIVGIHKSQSSRHGEIAFLVHNGSALTERMRLDKDGNVGIGTTSPEAGLHVVGGIHLPNASSISFDQAGGTLRNAILVDSGDDMIIGDTNFDDIYFSTGQKTKTVVIKQTTGNVGIGTASPGTLLHIEGDSGGGAGSTSPVLLTIKDADGGGSWVVGDIFAATDYVSSDGSGVGAGVRARTGIAQEASSGASSKYIIQTCASAGTLTDRVSVLSDGNVLMGTDESNPTSSSVNVAGQAFSTTGGVRSTVASDPAATFNRKTDDGDAVLFRKDGTTIGSIGVDFSDNLYISGKSDHAGIMFSNIEMYPYQNGTYRDATLDIGASSGRWKDLYLSGGAFLGGTGSANKLDDYEEGTWTPNWAGLGNGSTSGTYTKIGRLVHITALFTYGSTTDIGTKLEATNLPFSAQQITYGLTRMENYQQNSYIGAARANGTQFRGYVFNTSGDAATEMTVNTTRPFTWGEDDYAQLSVTYYTN
jgi:hypothetical protein